MENPSQHILFKELLALSCMAPSVVVLAYTHGKPGKDRWTQAEKVVVPVNLLLTLVLVVTFFGAPQPPW